MLVMKSHFSERHCMVDFEVLDMSAMRHWRLLRWGWPPWGGALCISCLGAFAIESTMHG